MYRTKLDSKCADCRDKQRKLEMLFLHAEGVVSLAGAALGLAKFHSEATRVSEYSENAI